MGDKLTRTFSCRMTEAEHTADRLLTLLQRTPWFHENYASATGEGWNAQERIGFPDYNWSHATVIELPLDPVTVPGTVYLELDLGDRTGVDSAAPGRDL